MKKFVYKGHEERVFCLPTRTLVVSPGESVEVESNPDEYWFEPAVVASKSEKE